MLRTLQLQGNPVTRTSLQVQLGGIPNTEDAGPDRVRTLLLVSSFFPDRNWMRRCQTRNTIRSDAAPQRRIK